MPADLLGDVTDSIQRFGDRQRGAAPLVGEAAVEVEGVGEGVRRVDRHHERPEGPGRPASGPVAAATVVLPTPPLPV